MGKHVGQILWKSTTNLLFSSASKFYLFNPTLILKNASLKATLHKTKRPFLLTCLDERGSAPAASFANKATSKNHKLYHHHHHHSI